MGASQIKVASEEEGEEGPFEGVVGSVVAATASAEAGATVKTAGKAADTRMEGIEGVGGGEEVGTAAGSAEEAKRLGVSDSCVYPVC